MRELLLCEDNTLCDQDTQWSHRSGLRVKPWRKLIGDTSRTLRMSSMGHGHVSAMASCRWVSWGAEHIGTVTVTIVVSLVILSRMYFRLFKVKINWVWSGFECRMKIQLELKLSWGKVTIRFDCEFGVALETCHRVKETTSCSLDVFKYVL